MGLAPMGLAPMGLGHTEGIIAPTVAMPRPTLSAGFPALALAVAAALAPQLGQAQAPLVQATVVQAPLAAPVAPSRRQPSAALSEERARAAAEQILKALREGDAEARFAQFAPKLQRMSSPAMVRSHLRNQPRILSWTLGSVVPGLDSSAVEARLVTSAGPRQLLMIIDNEGLLEGYHFDAADGAAETVARQFVQALIEGRYVFASSFLSPKLQEEIPPAALQRKWQALQQRTGTVVKMEKVARAEDTTDMKLVLVLTKFTRLNDNIFVILDRRNAIIGVDFPTDPALPSAR
jgi:hypothetical protein